MRMKKFNLMMWQGLLLSAFAFGLASCEPSDTPCPNKKEADGDTSQGVTVMLEMENVVTGETTRTALGDGDYSFTAKDGGGDVQAGGLGFYPKSKDRNDINVDLTYYAKENVVFQGWSWRYSEDDLGTHRGKTDAKLNDYVATPALQSVAGVQKLDLDAEATKFTCQYRPGTDNRVYVKVKYVKPTKKVKPYPKIQDLSLIDSKLIELEKVAKESYKYNMFYGQHWIEDLKLFLNNHMSTQHELIYYKSAYQYLLSLDLQAASKPYTDYLGEYDTFCETYKEKIKRKLEYVEQKIAQNPGRGDRESEQYEEALQRERFQLASALEILEELCNIKIAQQWR